MKTKLRLFGAMTFGLLGAATLAFAGSDSLVTAVYSSVSNGYERKKLPDGSFQKEYYALANGQYAPGQTENESIDKVPFPTIANLVAQHLAKQNYFFAQDSKSADILLIISWGTTVPFNDSGAGNSLDHTMSAMNAVRETGRQVAAMATGSGTSEEARSITLAMDAAAQSQYESSVIETQMYNAMRRQAGEHNARILGYVEEINYRDNPSRLGGAGSAYEDLIGDLEEERYYLVISAYDFRTAVRDGKRKLLWATRISVQAQGNRFDQRLATMLAKASNYFGRDSKRLLRQYQEGKVDIGEMKIMGDEPEPATPAKAPDEK
jgi:hypothetical protein